MPTLHAACIALGGVGALIRGPSGAGKSSLALLLAAGPDGALVADDRVVLDLRGGEVVARPHPSLAGLVEVCGLGILSAADLGIAVLPEVGLRLVIDLVAQACRLPDATADAEIVPGIHLPHLSLQPGVRAAGLAPLLIRAALRKAAPP